VNPYYADASVQLFLGDCRDVVPALDVQADCVVADPPYEETSLVWDRWPAGWPGVLAGAGVRSMWCFGSMRMFLQRRDEFAAWKLSQDLVWEKTHGSGKAVDRFRRVHEPVLHWYRGRWSTVHHLAPRTAATAAQVRRNGTAVRVGNPRHQGGFGASKKWQETGRRLVRSVLKVPNLRGRAVHPSEKPTELLDLLIRYACPEGGLVLDPFAGGGSTAVAARLSGRRAVLVEADERYCEVIALRLAQDVLPIGGGP
jgi:site-specific DNA-methyltransferase (adenine-specific)